LYFVRTQELLLGPFYRDKKVVGNALCVFVRRFALEALAQGKVERTVQLQEIVQIQ
jgi:hypothetical protein